MTNADKYQFVKWNEKGEMAGGVHANQYVDTRIDHYEKNMSYNQAKYVNWKQSPYVNFQHSHQKVTK